MELKSNQASPVLTDPAPLNKSKLGIHSNLLPYPQPGASFSGKYIAIPRKKPGKLDDVKSNGWLDAMKSSSPPRKKLIKDFTAEVALDDFDIAYSSWMVSKHHCSLLLGLSTVFKFLYIQSFVLLFVLNFVPLSFQMCSLNIHQLLNLLSILQVMQRIRRLLCSWTTMGLFLL